MLIIPECRSGLHGNAGAEQSKVQEHGPTAIDLGPSPIAKQQPRRRLESPSTLLATDSSSHAPGRAEPYPREDEGGVSPHGGRRGSANRQHPRLSTMFARPSRSVKLAGSLSFVGVWWGD
jgi:hypothetical protein